MGRWLPARAPAMHSIGRAASEKLSPWVALYLVSVAVLVYVSGHNAENPLYNIPGSSFGEGIGDSLDAISEGNVRRQIGFVLLGLTGAAVALRTRFHGLRVSPVVATAAAVLLAWSTISLVWAEDASLTFRRLAVLWLLVFSATGIVAATPRAVLPAFIGFSSAAYLVIGIGAEVWLGTLHPLATGYRFAGTLHPNAQGINCAFMSLVGLWFLTRRDRRMTAVALLLTVVGILFLLLTRSRTSFAAYVGAAIIMLILQFRPSRRIIVSAVLVNVGILMLLLYWYGLLDGILNLLLLGRGGRDIGTLNSRVPLWTLLGDYVAERPFLGYGYSGFMTEQHAAEVAVLVRFGVAGAHSIYLEITLGLGLVGLVMLVNLFLASIATGVRTSGWAHRGPDTLFVAILSFELLNGVLDSSMIFPSWRLVTLIAFGSLMVFPARPPGREPAWISSEDPRGAEQR